MNNFITKNRKRSLPPIVDEMRKKRQRSESLDSLTKGLKKIKKSQSCKSDKSMADYVNNRLRPSSDKFNVLQSIEKKSQSPEDVVQSIEKRSQSPEDVLESIEKRSQSPEDVVQSIEKRSQSPEDIKKSIENWLDDVESRQVSSEYSSSSQSPEPNSQFEPYPEYIQAKMELLKESLVKDEQIKSLYVHLQSLDKNEAEYILKKALFLDKCGSNSSQSLEQTYHSYLGSSFNARTDIWREVGEYTCATSEVKTLLESPLSFLQALSEAAANIPNPFI